MDLEDELGAGVVDEVGEVDCAVEAGVDVVVASALAVDEPSILVPSLDPLLITSVIALAKLAGQSSTYVVSPPQSSPPPSALSVGNSRYTPPCPSARTRIVTVTVTIAFLVLADVLVPNKDAKMLFKVPAAVMVGTVEEVEDAVVELT